MVALTCLRSLETNLTHTCPSPKSFVCNLPDSGRHVTSVFQGLSLSRLVGRVGENPGRRLNYYGFRRIVNQWFSSYLSNRTQTTEIGSHISSKLNVNCGVPQGSVLGPLLFCFIYMTSNIVRANSNFSFLLTTITLFMLLKI